VGEQRDLAGAIAAGGGEVEVVDVAGVGAATEIAGEAGSRNRTWRQNMVHCVRLHYRLIE
jgi:hypothetical protein